MNLQLSDHFTYKKLLRYTAPSIVMMIFTFHGAQRRPDLRLYFLFAYPGVSGRRRAAASADMGP